MPSPSLRPGIKLRGVSHNNLKNIDLDLPLNRLIVITGLSGSGKSSLAFDTLFAEGQRRYIETFSPYARQFLDRMDKPKVESIEGIPPAIAVEQRNAVRTTRSTVGTMTEICDYMKVLWPHIAQLHCPNCGIPVGKDSAQAVWQKITARGGIAEDWEELLVTFTLPLSEKLSIAESLGLIAKQGYQRVITDGRVMRLDELHPAAKAGSEMAAITVVQDRLRLTRGAKARFVEACEQAYHFGQGKLCLWQVQGPSLKQGLSFSCALHCGKCDFIFREPSPALFSFNHPLGACPTCRGFGRIISIDYSLAIPDRTRTLSEGLVRPWQTGQGAECQTDMLRACRQRKIPVDVPFNQLSSAHQALIIEGDPDYGIDEDHQWPAAWYGVKGYFRWLESKAYKMHVRVLLSRYRAYTACPDCKGKRFRPECLNYRLRMVDEQNQERELSLADFYGLPIRDALAYAKRLLNSETRPVSHGLDLALAEVHSRLSYLDEVGLGYLTLDRPTRTLSGGETERVNLTTCLGTRLVNTLFVLDEPSVGLHPRDTDRLVSILKRLKNNGNTVVVVEHEATVMRAADQIIDLGPGHGATGGEVVFQGTYDQIAKCKESLTGQYLAGSKRIERLGSKSCPELNANANRVPSYEMGSAAPLELNEKSDPIVSPEDGRVLRISGARKHNLKDLTLEIPLGRFVCLTGVSGSGKSTLLREVLLPGLRTKLTVGPARAKASERIDSETEPQDDDATDVSNAASDATIKGWEHIADVVLVDQSAIGKTPRSNPAVYIGAFDQIRDFFAETEEAKQKGLNSSAFSFNSPQGQCKRCRGAGFEKIEMQFLSDIFIRCPGCDGRRYQAHILEVRALPASARSQSKSIGDVLESTVEEAQAFLSLFPESRHARRAVESLNWLEAVGLGYLKLGQPINTLSGGESQRLKLVRYLADSGISVADHSHAGEAKSYSRGGKQRDGDYAAVRRVLFLFDEPTTGLHFEDINVLLQVFRRIVAAGHSIIVVEHNLDVIKCADWVVDLGPEAGDQGGRVVAAGCPEKIAACIKSHTGSALRTLPEFSKRRNSSDLSRK